MQYQKRSKKQITITMEDFARWLQANNLQSYQQAFENEGYDDVKDLAGLSDTEVDELATTVAMRPGHKKKLVRILVEVRLQKMEEEQSQADREVELKRKEAERKRKMREIERMAKKDEEEARLREETKEVITASSSPQSSQHQRNPQVDNITNKAAHELPEGKM